MQSQVMGKLNQTGYHSIFQHRATPCGTCLVGRGFVLMQDKDPKHTIPCSVQNGNSSVQNGKIIISINIKNIL